MNSNRPRLSRRGGINRFDERHIEGAAESESFGKNCRSRKHSAVRAFLIFKERNFQARLSQHDFLKVVEVLNLLPGPFMQDCVGKRKKAGPWADLVGVG